MICTNCGAHLMETDQFCPKCGTKAIKDKRCPDCGAVLRDGAKFCPKCGRLVGENGSARGVSDDTLDIPIDAIERNILSETAAEIKADHRTGSVPRKTASHSSTASSTSAHSSSGKSKSTASRSSSTYAQSERNAPRKSSASHASAQGASVKKRAADDVDEAPRRQKSANPELPRKKKTADPEPPRKKKVVYREDDWEDEDWEDDDWDEDDWDDDDEGVDAITIMTAIVGCVLLVVVAVLGFHLYRQNVPKNYDKVAEEEQEQQEKEDQQEEQDRNGEQEPEGGQDTSGGDERETTTLTVTYEKVNVRDQPSTDGTNILKKALEGETYPCYGSVEGGEWYEILLEDGTIGYIFYEYVSVE